MKKKNLFFNALLVSALLCSNLSNASVIDRDSSAVSNNLNADSSQGTNNSESMLAVKSRGHIHGGSGGGGGSSFSVGGQLAYNMYLGGGGNMLGLGVNGEYYGGGKYAFRFLYNYHFAISSPTQLSLISQYNYQPSYWTGSTLDTIVNGKAVVNVMTFGIDVKKPFGHDYNESGFYGCGGLGLTLASETVTTDPYNANNWTPAETGETGTQNFSQVNIRLAIGYDAHLSFGTIFAEALLIFPVNEVNGMAVDVSIPTALSFQAGVGIPLTK